MLAAKKIKIALLFVTLIGSAGLFAQVQQPAAPEQATNVSDAELENFATAYMGMQMENQKAQQKIMKTIEGQGLEVERFQEIQEATADPNKEVDATEEEKTKHKNAIAEIEKMRPEFESKMEAIIKDSGLTVERYQAVGAAIQADKALQQKLQGIMVKKTQG
ncbi:DUF4168 domain-containing protein [Galbibacter pacificus]|uniref:DUF4168 domain-containing protein n=1 Tax=Galbibacter pacificus TaxID=2996052 RepID=A0ABT6FUB4_9FLAO|nr:DUF4168 domain-containing protein [Galbibacter pacificus]MDG3583666.1 DUF4168 domain-containing protein [Galbibacter pacificus]MDG3586858.1 DUF4168 domain-containing protein [Galbibacter pacificus]